MDTTSLLEAVKISKLSPVSELVVPSVSLCMTTLGEMQVTVRHFKDTDGQVKKECLLLRVPQYLLRMMLDMLTKKPTAYKLFTSLEPHLAVSAINDVLSKYPTPLHIMYDNGSLLSIVPNFYTVLQHQHVLSGFINDDMPKSFANALFCDQTRIARVVFACGEPFTKSVAGIAVINSELAILDPTKISPISLTAQPCIWYPEQQLCALLPSSHYPHLTTKQMHKSRADVMFDFMVDLELRKLHESVHDRHKDLLVSTLGEDETAELTRELKRIDPGLTRKLKHILTQSAYTIYETLLASTRNYTPQYRIKLERAAGFVYANAR